MSSARRILDAVSGGLRRRLHELAVAAVAIAGGDRDRRLPLDDDDPDLRSLAESVNRITETLVRNENLLGDNIRSLQRVNQELRETQEGLLRSEKLATIGRLSAGVAHEIGNPLGAILGYLDLLRRSPVDDDTRDWLGRMETEARRIDTIIRELLDFARPSEATLQPVDVNEAVISAVTMLSHQKMFARVQLERDLAQSLPLAMAERHRLRQVVVNLMLNAADAMVDGGTIQVSTRLVAASTGAEPQPKLPPRRRDDPPQADFSHLRPSLAYDPTPERPLSSLPHWVQIQVADNGRGIPSDQLRSVFDPFFTTKPPGKGTGLGLAITLSTIQSFHGRIHIASQVEIGTTITMEIPVAANPG